MAEEDGAEDSNNPTAEEVGIIKEASEVVMAASKAGTTRTSSKAAVNGRRRSNPSYEFLLTFLETLNPGRLCRHEHRQLALNGELQKKRSTPRGSLRQHATANHTPRFLTHQFLNKQHAAGFNFGDVQLLEILWRTTTTRLGILVHHA